MYCTLSCPLSALLSPPQSKQADGGNRQNSLGHVVLHNRQNNEFQLSTNAHKSENGVTTNDTGGLCPTCHRPLTSGSEHPDSFTPSFLDSDYFRLLSSFGSDTASDEEIRPTHGIGDAPPPIPQDDGERRSGSLPSSAFNQGYFERFPCTTLFC